MTAAIVAAMLTVGVFVLAFVVTWLDDVRRRRWERRRELQDLQRQERFEERQYRRGLRDLG